ncbi:hypothetical protein [Dongshaea marina]|nr:hypothetical protein [Dongshaea marina]
MVRILQSYRISPFQENAQLYLIYTRGKTLEPKIKVVVESIIESLGGG